MEATIDKLTKIDNKEKEPFILYNTMAFLFDETIPSLQLISQSVALEQSDIARRLTQYQAKNDKINL